MFMFKISHFKIEFWAKYNFGLLYHIFTPNLINYQIFKHVFLSIFIFK